VWGGELGKGETMLQLTPTQVTDSCTADRLSMFCTAARQ
jgi:hypothetical protein